MRTQMIKLARAISAVLAITAVGATTGAALPVAAGAAVWPAVTSAAANPAPAVVPALREWAGGSGTSTLGSRIVVDPSDEGQLGPDANTFASDIAEITGSRPAVVVSSRPAPGDVFLTLGADIGHPQGYRLSIGDVATIAGQDAGGVFYGEQTVEQLLKLADGSEQLPRGTAVDWPSSSYRGVMLDLGRHYYSVSYVLDQIRTEAWDKLDVIHLHFTEQNAFRLVSTTYPGLAAPQAYTHADIARIVDYAHRYHVTIVPEIDVPGHAVPIGQFDPALQWDCKSMNGSAYQYWPGFTLDITKQATTVFVTNLLKEFVPLFKYSPVFHLGGDEYPELAAQQQCPELVSYAQGQGYASTEDVFVAWLNKMAAVVTSLGKRPEIWNWWDVAGGATITPDKNIIIDAWTGSPDAYLSAGYDTVSSPGNLIYVTPGGAPGTAGTDNATLYDSWTPETAGHLLGYEVSRWSDNAATMPDSYQDWFAERTEEVVADRIWGAPRAYASQYAFENAVDRIGTAPGVPEYGDPGAVLLHGTPYGTSPPYEAGNGYGNAFDGDPTTFFDYSQADGGYTGTDLGAGNAAVVTKIRFVPRANQVSRMVGGQFQGCTTGPASGCRTLATVSWTPGADWHQLIVTDPSPYRWLRYVGPDGGFCNVAEIQFYTSPRQAGQLTVTAPGTIRPGGHGTVTTTVVNTIDQPLHLSDLRLEAYSADDDTALPLSTTDHPATVPAGGRVTATWRIGVPEQATAGTYRLTARAIYGTGAGEQETTATVTTLVPYPSLASSFDNVGITDDSNNDPADLLTGFDDYDGTYSAQALAAAGVTPDSQVSAGGVTFTWPDAQPGAPDNTVSDGQSIEIGPPGTAARGKTLGFLAAASFGPAGGTGTISYTDGTTQTFTISAPDWTAPTGSGTAITTTYHNWALASPSQIPTDAYVATVSLDPDKTVANVTLPVATGPSSESKLHIFAISIS